MTNDTMSASGQTGTKGNAYFAFSVGITLLAFLVYLPSLWCGFVNWDDDIYVYANPDLRSLDFNFIRWSLTALVNDHWYPLTIISFALDYTFWGLDPTGYHLTNVILHLLNTLLVFFLATRLFTIGNGNDTAYGTGPLVTGVVTALLFALHPLHVESVAWVTERKDVLYAFFFLLSITFYLEYVCGSGKKTLYYALMLLSFVLSLMSKPMAVTLPVALLILDYYPLSRRDGLARLVGEKAPLFVLSLTSSVITILAMRSGVGMISLDSLPALSRLLITVRGYAFYLYKTVLPFELFPFYSIPDNIGFLSPEFAGSIALVLGVTVFCIATIKKNKHFAAAWFFYLVTLFPVIGVFQSGGQAAADRFTYIPLLGPFLLLGLGASAFYRRSSARKRVIHLCAAALLTALLSYATVVQINIWRDSITLWTRGVALNPDSKVALTNLGLAYNTRGKPEKAVEFFKRAIVLWPQLAGPRVNLGIAYFNLGDFEKAEAEFKEALRLEPGFAEAHNNLGFVAINKGLKDEAIVEFQEAIRLRPDYAGAKGILGVLYAEQGRIDAAIEELEAATVLEPRNAVFRQNLELAYRMKRHADRGAEGKGSVLEERKTKGP